MTRTALKWTVVNPQQMLVTPRVTPPPANRITLWMLTVIQDCALKQDLFESFPWPWMYCTCSRVVYYTKSVWRTQSYGSDALKCTSSHPIEKKALIVERMQAIHNLQHVRDVRGWSGFEPFFLWCKREQCVTHIPIRREGGRREKVQCAMCNQASAWNRNVCACAQKC